MTYIWRPPPPPQSYPRRFAALSHPVNHITTGTGGSASSYITNAFVAHTGRHYLIAVTARHTSQPPIPTLTRTDMTFELLADAGTGVIRLYVFLGIATASSSAAITIDFSPTTISVGATWGVSEAKGLIPTTPILQTVEDDALVVGGGAYTLPYGAFGDPDNFAWGAVGPNNAQTESPAANWQELHNTGTGSPGVGLFGTFQDNDQANLVITASGGTSPIIGLELNWKVLPVGGDKAQDVNGARFII